MLGLQHGIDILQRKAREESPKWRTLVQAAKTGDIVRKRGSIVTRVLEAHPDTGQISYHHYDLQSDICVIEDVQDCEPILDWNKAVAKTDYAAAGIKSEFMHAARVPFGLIDKWRQEGLNYFSKDERDQREVTKRLNSPEYKYLRTGNQSI